MISDRVPILGYKEQIVSLLCWLNTTKCTLRINHLGSGDPLGLHRPIPLMKGHFHSHVLSCLEYDMGWFSYAIGVRIRGWVICEGYDYGYTLSNCMGMYGLGRDMS